MKTCCCLLLMFAVQQQGAFGRSHTTSDIDRYCLVVQNRMGGVTPFVFSGPEPWVELDDAPTVMVDQAIAYVYTEGPAIRWVFMRIVDERGEWAENVHYYFREDGSIAKRVRKVQSIPANMEFEATTYYAAERVLKETTHHHALGRGRQNSSEFVDPEAPRYLTVDDLPFPEIPDLWRRLS